jgi:predicted nucleotidyltransferase
MEACHSSTCDSNESPSNLSFSSKDTTCTHYEENGGCCCSSYNSEDPLSPVKFQEQKIKINSTKFQNFLAHEHIEKEILNKLNLEINKVKTDLTIKNKILIKRREKIYKKINDFFMKKINLMSNKYQILKMLIYGSTVTGDSTVESDQDFKIVVLSLYEDSKSSYLNYINLIRTELGKIVGDQNVSEVKGDLGGLTNVLITADYYKNNQIFKIDLCFNRIYNKNSINDIISLPIFKMIHLKKYYYSIYPQLLQIFFVLKEFLLNNKLNETFTGGLSSTGLFLILVSYFKFLETTKNYVDIKNMSPSEILNEFLYHFSWFNFEDYLIDISKSNPYVKKDKYCTTRPFIMNPFLAEKNILSYKYPINIDKIQKTLRLFHKDILCAIKDYKDGNELALDNFILDYVTKNHCDEFY